MESPELAAIEGCKHKMGLFTTKAIKKGELVCGFWGSLRERLAKQTNDYKLDVVKLVNTPGSSSFDFTFRVHCLVYNRK